ncbi:MAG: ABC transporter permease [Flavobacteriaceae bacterium]
MFGNKKRLNSIGVLSLSYILILLLLALTATLWAPDNSRHANRMQLSIHSKAPGFSVLVYRPDTNTLPKSHWFFGVENPAEEIPVQTFEWVEEGRLYIWPYGSDEKQLILTDGPTDQATQQQMTTDLFQQRSFPLGTDKYGRDLWSRLLFGSRVSLGIGFIAVFISLSLGIFIGGLAGYFGGLVDRVLVNLMNIVWSIPTLLLVLAISLALGKGIFQVFIAVGLTMWVDVARLVRGQVLSVKELTFVEAAQTLGFSKFRIFSYHILPMLTGPLLVVAASNFASAILIESGLSFLGIGAQPPIPTWGGMVKDHFRYLVLGQPHLALLPGVAIMSLVLAFMLLGNSLRDFFDTRLELPNT